MADLKALAEQLVNLTIKEANDLAQILEADYGIKPAAAAVAVAAGPAAAADAAPVEEQTEFDVILTGLKPDAKKVEVIKVVRGAVSGLGLAEAKALVDQTPSTLKSAISKGEAEELKKTLEAAGGVVELK
ncbi:MAG: 50S ribosomal protein L7/L12 [Rhodothermia bacterium]|nr:50S ribosomal protein L7/L12 [Rhodothermia bacterium]